MIFHKLISDGPKQDPAVTAVERYRKQLYEWLGPRYEEDLLIRKCTEQHFEIGNKAQ